MDNTFFSVNTVYPVAALGINPVEDVSSEDDTTEAIAEDSTPTQSFLPTVAVIENSSEASTIKPETHTVVPFIPSILPEATFAVTDETHVMTAVEGESTEDAAGEASDIIATDITLENIAEQEEEAETEVAEEMVTDGKAVSGLILSLIRRDKCID